MSSPRFIPLVPLAAATPCRAPKFKAVLMGVYDLPRAKQTMEQTQAACEVWSQNTLADLDSEQRKTAYVRVTETRDIVLVDIHPAVEPGHFAFTRYADKIVLQAERATEAIAAAGVDAVQAKEVK